MTMTLFGDDLPVQANIPTFDEWYANYPKKQGKAQARKRWGKLSDAEKIEAWDALAGWNRKAQAEGKTFIPMASTWLNQSRWEDDAPEITQPQLSAKQQRVVQAQSSFAERHGLTQTRKELQ